MKTLIRLLFVLPFLINLSVQAQVSQELINKAKASGMTDAQIQQEINKQLRQQSNERQTTIASNAAISDRSEALEEELLLSEQPVTARSLGMDVKNIVFGREIFSNKNLSFAPDMNIPTPRNYILSAGDEVFINVWGDSELNLKLKISPEGTVLIPNLGPVAVSGLTVDRAEDRLRQELGRIMTTLSEGEPNTHVSVSLSQIRSIKVNIVGEVIAPGTYTLPSFATLFNALYVAGGVNDIGTLRSIKLYRNSKKVAELDVYDYLLNGQSNTNIRLEENDMVMVGPYEQLVVVQGKVKRNRIFEFRKGETLQQVLDMAGGFTGDAYTKDVRVKRKSDQFYQIATINREKFASFPMQDGDSLLVDAVVPFYENRLTITGAVWRPGEYELTAEVHTIKQLVKQAAGLKGDEFTGRAQLTRLNTDFTTTMIAVDIVSILNGAADDIELQKEDQLHIPSLFDLREPYTIKVSGAVNKSGAVIPYKYNMTIEDAILLAGGLRESAAAVNVEVARRLKNPYMQENTNRIAETFSFSLNDNLTLKHGETIFTLEPYDEVYIRRSPGYQEQQVVVIDGEITFSGHYVLAEKNERLSSIVAKAGGITPDAYIKGANLRRKLSEDDLQRIRSLLDMGNNQGGDSVIVKMSNLKDYAVGIDLDMALKHPGSEYDMVLQDGDKLYIPQYQSTVKISGSVNYPNSVTYTKGMSVKDGLSNAGGYNDIARKYPIVIYMNGKVATTKRILIFFKKYPKVEPGCEIVTPAKRNWENRTTLAERLSMATSTTSLAAMVTSIINTMTK
ncbi:MAG: SLBB domain-containing protein [Tannerellaceae bacterium]|jgi:protein involved in polysaccharide export with SLBB domain|nr:SLBB domain-containing protein [Tannerellaceae bacterium]